MSAATGMMLWRLGLRRGVSNTLGERRGRALQQKWACWLLGFVSGTVLYHLYTVAYFHQNRQSHYFNLLRVRYHWSIICPVIEWSNLAGQPGHSRCRSDTETMAGVVFSKNTCLSHCLTDAKHKSNLGSVPSWKRRNRPAARMPLLQIIYMYLCHIWW